MARERQLRMLLRKRAGTLHFGPLADCHFTDPRRARLQGKGATDATQPLVSACQPNANACVTAEHAPQWKQGLLSIDNLLADRSIPRNERARLKEEKRRIQSDVLDRLEPGDGG